MQQKTNSMVLNEILSNSNQNDRNQDFRVEEVLRDFNVSNEDEFMKVLNDDWNYVKCVRCKNKIDILNCRFEDGISVICPKCGSRC